MTCDCLILGYYDFSFAKYLEMTRSMGSDTGAFRDVNLAFIEVDGEPYRALDIYTRFYNASVGVAAGNQLFHNMDFLWPTISYLGTFLHRHGHSFDYVNLIHLQMDALKEKLLNQDIRTIAVTTTLYVYPQPILEIISFIRKYNQKAKILLGGPYVGNQTQDADMAFQQGFFRQMGADIYVDSNEGEQALLRVIEALKGGGDLSQVSNIAYRRGDDFIINPREIEANPLEENQVDYSLFPREEFNEFVSLRTAKSCPFSCAFCGFPSRAGAYKYLPVELVEKELNQLHELGVVTTVTFLDDTFNVPKKRFKELLRMMIRNNYGFKWNSFYRSDHGDEETIDLMRQAGCEGVFLGMESGSDTILKEMNKTARQKHYRQAIPLLREAGIATHASLVIGFPGETFATYQETAAFIDEVRPDTFRAQLWYADPVTPVWQRREELRIQGSAFKWSHYTMDSATACELVDRMFLSIKNSVWLPQNGFEQWSLFYLQRRGMKLADIKRFLRSFNEIIKDKLVRPEEPAPLPHLVENLKKHCRLQDLEPRAETYTAETYQAAERFWVARFREPLPAGGSKIPATGQMEVVRRYLKTEDLDALAAGVTAARPTVLLAAYATLLGRINGVEDVALLADIEAGETSGPLPLRLRPAMTTTFPNWAAETQAQWDEAAEHGKYALRVVPNTILMSLLGAVSPHLDAALLYRENTCMESAAPVEPLHWPADLWNGLTSRLEVVVGSDEIRLDFTYRDQHFSSETMNRIAEVFIGLLNHLLRDPQTSLDEIEWESGQPVAVEIMQDDLETFSF